MPYIKPENRKKFTQALELISKEFGYESPGTLNYLFTAIANSYVRANGLSYQAINDVLGALEGAKLEFYRRTAVDYENAKIKENGDV